ncbi:collagen alpha-1(I) chain [Drosophila ficusphila]|uniref:collagen alpha-1(I) chain n=1 Tax=Drosophila ficusphila TaxID=30025 RepID=UPI0007E85475|nr:collagen alpha-1(I) chain [Drosophila ficusphila]
MQPNPKRKLLLVLVLSLLAIVCLADVSQAKHHKHQRHHHSKEHEDEDEESHYLPPQEEKDKDQPYYKKEKHTSERVVYHKEDEHEEPQHHKEYHHEEPKKQRVDHYHHYDKKPEVKTQHIHYKHSTPHARTDYNRDLFTPAATQVVYRRRRPSRILYASAPNSVFHHHTQINVQSQDSELNSLTRPDFGPGAQDPAGAQANTGAQAPGFRPNCQFIGPGNVNPGCGPSVPVGAQLPAGALAPTEANLPASQPAPVPGGQLAVLGNGQRPPLGPDFGGYGGGKRLNFFVDPSLGAQLGAIGNAAAGGQQAAGGAQLGGAQLAGGAQLGAGQGFDPSFGAQAAAGAPFDPSFGGQAPVAQRPVAQAPVQVQYNPNVQLGGGYNPSLGGAQLGTGQGVANQRPSGQAPFDPSFGAQLGTGQGIPSQRPIAQAPFDPALGAQLGTGQAVPNQRPNPVNPPQGAQLAAGQGAFDPNQGIFDPSVGAQLAAGQVPRLNNRRPPNRSNYQGLNVLNGNVFGQPHLQGPTNALGNQQDTNIIDGNFYSDPHHGHQRALVSVNPNQRSILLPADDDDDADGDSQSGFLGFAASNRRSTYVVAPKKHRSHRSSSKRKNLDQGTSASEYDTDYREDGYHYQKPKHTFEF